MSKELGVHLEKRAFLKDESGESDSSEVHPHPGLRQHVHYDTPVLGHSTWREWGGREGGERGVTVHGNRSKGHVNAVGGCARHVKTKSV